MNDKVHRYLDGELSKGDLTENELREAARHETVIRETGAAFREVEVPDLTARVMMRLPAEIPDAMAAPAARPVRQAAAGSRARGGALSAALEWLWNPRPIQLRPAWGLVAAAVMGLALWGGLQSGDAPDLERASLAAASDSALDSAAGPVAAAKVFVQFRLDVREATAVRLAGSFTEWEAEYDLHETAPGVWSILVPLAPGVHDYAFVVDGDRWVSDPTAPQVDDGFGGMNSRLAVLLPQQS